MQTLKQELVTLPHDHCMIYSDHAVRYIASRRLQEKSASIEQHGHYDKEPTDLKFGTHKPHISLAREAGAECCDTLDASPIQHKAARKSAQLMHE